MGTDKIVVNFQDDETPEHLKSRKTSGVAYKVWMQLKAMKVGQVKSQVFNDQDTARRVQVITQTEAAKLKWKSINRSKPVEDAVMLYRTRLEPQPSGSVKLWIETFPVE